MAFLKRALVFLGMLLVFATVPVLGQQPAQPQAPEQTEEFVPIDQLPQQDQMPAAPLLIAAYSVLVLTLFGYVVSVARRLNVVQQEVRRLESDQKRGSRA